MVLFNFSRWIAKEITGPKNVDHKIFIVGGAGDGKSMTGLTLARRIAKWVSYFNHNKDVSHAEKYFKFDKDHIAVISTDDLIHVMTTPLSKNSIKVIDDCGASKGFTSRRAMSQENLDIISIYGTNRVRNGVTIICVQDTDFTDIRMRMLANEIIDLTDYYQSGPCRMAKLYKIRKDKNVRGGIKKRRFMTYENGTWITIESIACFMPSEKDKIEYDILREQKEEENTSMINKKYDTIKKNMEVNNIKKHCPMCNSVSLRYNEEKGYIKCKSCGTKF